MSILYEKLKNFSIEDAMKIEESDRQLIALKKLYKNIKDKEIYLSLILANSIICYQLSGKGEDYWEEFGKYFSENFCDKENFLNELKKFLKQCKNNKRFIDTKIGRINKLELFFNGENQGESRSEREYPGIFFGKEKFFYKNMKILRNDLAKTMNQKIDAKTVVFAVKMFGYGARNVFDFEKYPEEIKIPIDSRLENLFEKYGNGKKNAKIFYEELSKKLKIPELHLDAILWVNYEELIK